MIAYWDLYRFRPSWIGAMMALDNMVSDKVEFCKQYQIDITEEQWPSHHIPEIIIADRGEFEGYADDSSNDESSTHESSV